MALEPFFGCGAQPFWAWLQILLKFASLEIYRTKDDSGHTIGGPAFYISRGLKGKWAKFQLDFSLSLSSSHLALSATWFRQTPFLMALAALLAYRSG
ncbi:alanine:cation symporter family protein [Campylobacter concisus]